MKYTVILLISLCIVACTNQNKNKYLKEVTSEYNKLSLEVKTLKKEIDSLESVLATKKSPWFDDMESRELKEMGIDDPQQYIQEHLKEQATLIPIDGVLGGKMFFTQIEVLGSKWLIASYEDGHIMGRSIFTYHINPETLEVIFEELSTVNPY